MYDKEIDNFQCGAVTPNILFGDKTGAVSSDRCVSYNIKNDICADEYGITDELSLFPTVSNCFTTVV